MFDLIYKVTIPNNKASFLKTGVAYAILKIVDCHESHQQIHGNGAISDFVDEPVCPNANFNFEKFCGMHLRSSSML
jgi:hypothetical protein